MAKIISPKSYKQWVEKEGSWEHPTHLETLQQPDQQARLDWLIRQCVSSKKILDIGCNWGYILNEVDGDYGVDINPENIEKAKQEFPLKEFSVGDITQGLNFRHNSFDIVIEADILEHLRWFDEVEMALREATRITRQKLLITLPWRKDYKCAYCFKHQWIPNEETVGKIIIWLMKYFHSVIIECDGNFVYIEAIK